MRKGIALEKSEKEIAGGKEGRTSKIHFKKKFPTTEDNMIK